MARKSKRDQKPVPWQQFECSFILSLLKDGIASKLRGRLRIEGDRLIIRGDCPDHSWDLREQTFGPLFYAVADLPTGVTPIKSVVYRCLAQDGELIDREAPLYWLPGHSPKRGK